MKSPFRLSARTRRGTSLASYGVLLGVVSVAVVGAVSNLGGVVQDNYAGVTASLSSSLSSSGVAADAATGERIFTEPGTTTWTVPENVTEVSIVAVGAGGAGSIQGNKSYSGGGGALVYANEVAVTPGETIDVVVGGGGLVSETGDGGASRVGSVLTAGGGDAGYSFNAGGPGGTPSGGDQGFVGGSGSEILDGDRGGGQAGGYYRAGLDGDRTARNGGGVGLYCGPDTGATDNPYDGWFGGEAGSLSNASGAYGGGGGADHDFYSRESGNDGADGAVRVIWGEDRAFPDENCG